MDSEGCWSRVYDLISGQLLGFRVYEILVLRLPRVYALATRTLPDEVSVKVGTMAHVIWLSL